MQGLKMNIVPAIQCEIPYTSRERYITGIYALNVQSPEETTGDWHDVFHWLDGVERPRVITIAGEGMKLNTNPIYHNYGIYEGRSRLIDAGLIIDPSIKEIYIANHFRAILDLLYRTLMKYEAVYNLTGATNDWLDTPEQKAFLLEKAELLSNVFQGKAKQSLYDWIEQERVSV